MAQKLHLPKGNGYFLNGQLHLLPGRKDRSAPSGAYRLDGRPKALTVPAIAHGMKHQGADRKTLSDFHHGIPVQDEPLIAKLGYGQPDVPIHSGMRSETSGKIPGNPMSREKRGNTVYGQSSKDFLRGLDDGK